MKRIVMLVLAVACTWGMAQACDICGFGVSNYNPFLFPHLSHSYVGFTYQHRYYRTIDDDGAIGNEYYNSFLVTGQYGVSKKLQLVALVPYQYNKLKTADGTQTANGLGDITLLGNYNIWNKSMGVVHHTVMAGAGVKLPTGIYKTAKTDALDDQNFQRGTGSTDYLLNASYRIGYRKWIVSTVASYKYNTANKDNYRYGDQFTAGATVIYRKDFDGFSIAPYAQVLEQKQMKDADDHVLQDHSGGHVLYTGAGVDMNTRKIAFGLNYQFASSQNLAESHIIVKPGLSAHISIML